MRRSAASPLVLFLLLFLLLAGVAATTAIVFERDIHDFYVAEVVAPRLQRELGFRTGEIRLVEGGREYAVSGITAVDPGGVFGRAGFRAGDIPVGYQHGFFSGFYQHLSTARGTAVTIRVVRPEAPSAQNARELTVTVPRG